MQPQAAAMQALLNEPSLQVMPGCGDGMGARLIEEAGVRTGFASGSSISAMRLAMPDMDLLTFPEMRETVETIIAAAPNVLWLADGDTGYGNAISVQKTIRAYARAGAAAVLIEDKIWPRPLGHNGAKLVIERDEALLRCRAAVEACHEEGILLLARTDARVSRGFDEALARIKAFVAAGADILFLEFAAVGGGDARLGRGVRGQAVARRDLAGRQALHARRRGVGAARHQARRLSAGDPRRDRPRGARRAGGAEGRCEGGHGTGPNWRPRSGRRTTWPATNAWRAEADDCARQTSQSSCVRGLLADGVPSVTHSDTRRPCRTSRGRRGLCRHLVVERVAGLDHAAS